MVLPSKIQIRDYQKDAIRAWSKNGGRGVLAMATGSGKTLTALVLATKVAERNSPLVIIIICPFLNLCRQWERELGGFGIQPVSCYEGQQRWVSRMEESYQQLQAGLSSVLALVVSNDTFQSEAFQSRIKPHLRGSRYHHLLIADEVHNLGAPNIQECLPDSIAMRVGLSATPERHYDPAGTAAVLNYFGGIIYEFPIARAIAEGRLSPYRYYAVPVDLTENEAIAYAEITAKLSKCFRGNSDSEEELNQATLRLLIKRARILGSAANKISALDNVVSLLPERPTKAIFYCGDGSSRDGIRDEEVRQIQAVSRLLGEKHRLRVRNFTCRESPQEREEILRDLSSGFLDGVVAIRCLDEGIDLPDLRMGFLLASSTNPRQFVQRRGRLLRNAPGKSRALIYDFFVQPPELGGASEDAGFNQERSFFQRELKRISEFCRMAENGPEALHTLRSLRMRYNLLAE